MLPVLEALDDKVLFVELGGKYEELLKKLLLSAFDTVGPLGELDKKLDDELLDDKLPADELEEPAT